MNVKVVIGANYGDEGKGLVSGWLAKEAAKRNERVLTCFYNGTAQRAHTFEGQVRRGIAAGAEYGSDTFYHKMFVVDPISVMLEHAKPIIDGECRIILPCDVITNRTLETERGAARHGSCGFGLFEAVKRSQRPDCAVFAKDLADPYSMYEKLRRIRKKYPMPKDEIYNLDMFMRAVAYINKFCRIRSFEETAGSYDTIIYEGGQGLLLDQTHIEDYPHLTPSSPGSSNIRAEITDIGVVPELYYVSRTYLTRHGAGPMENECAKDDINPDIVDETNQPNEFQGSLRFGKLKQKSLYERVMKDAAKYSQKKINLVFTQLNYTDGKLSDGSEIVKPKGFDRILLSAEKDRINDIF